MGHRPVTRILLTGASGLLGSAFRRLLPHETLTVLARSRLSMAPDQIVRAVAQARPDIVVNCAAHTDLEAAERDPSLGHAVNALLPGLLGQACQTVGALLVHISSTGCYGDWKQTPYIETDLLRPTSAHHRAKAEGEDAVRHAVARHVIVRTGWLFGGEAEQSKNFVWKRLLEAQGAVRITSDAHQRGCPTCVDDLARQALAIVSAGATGTFNAVAQGQASRYEYVAAIVEASGLSCSVEPGPPFRRLAPVSSNETALNAALNARELDNMPGWREAVCRYTSELIASPSWLALCSARAAPL